LADPLVLGFDTSAAHCAAAVVSGGRVLASRTEPMEKGQAERLVPMLEEVLAEAGAAWSGLAAIGVGTGPGNFTGVRISVAAARGLALALKVPAIGVSVLEAMALGTEGPVLVQLDARRGQVYRQRFDAQGAHGPGLFQADDPAPGATGATVIGDAAAALAQRTGGSVAAPRHHLAVAIALIAAARAKTPQPRPAPLYLRPADAALPSDPPPVILP
jgi:tRNA threonylcarbamoyl adenosine modification protein YeaZ